MLPDQDKNMDHHSSDSSEPSHRPEVPKCPFCSSIITLSCEAIKSPRRLPTPETEGFISVSTLVEGSKTGCPDCGLLHSAVKVTVSSEYVEKSVLWVILNADTGHATDGAQLKIKFSVRLPDRSVQQIPEHSGYTQFIENWQDGDESEHSSMEESTYDRNHDALGDACNALIQKQAAFQSEDEFLQGQWQIFRVKGKPRSPKAAWSNIWSLPLPSRDTSSTQAYQKVQTWIETCFKNHAHCSKNEISQLPKRVLQITESFVYLCEFAEKQEKYACLSHCWGPKGPLLQLTPETKDTLQRGIRRAELPRTFADAVEICDRLRISYIWIDALCIIQGDSNDWEEAARTMASIYENSYVTLAASRSYDSSSGCFSSTQDRDSYEAYKLNNDSLYVRRTPPPFPSGSPYSNLLDWPLLSRGWVFQERILAPRVVHYAKEQLYWECDSCLLDEYGLYNWYFEDDASYHTFENDIRPLKYRRDDPETYWRNSVMLYTNLEFTKNKDVLPALAGVVEREMRYRKGDVYIAGMWENSLIQDLAHYHMEYVRRVRENDHSPTWSWASVEGPAEFLTVHKHPSVSLLGLNYKRTSSENIGKVTNASLKIRGPVLLARFASYTFLPLPHGLIPFALSTQTVNAISNIRIVHYMSPSILRDFKEDTVYTILVLSSFEDIRGSAGIILEPVSANEPRRYRKVGVVSLRCRHEVGQAYFSTGKYAEEYESYVDRLEGMNMDDADDDEVSSTFTGDSDDITDDDKIELMNELIDVLPIREVEII